MWFNFINRYWRLSIHLCHIPWGKTILKLSYFCDLILESNKIDIQIKTLIYFYVKCRKCHYHLYIFTSYYIFQLFLFFPFTLQTTYIIFAHQRKIYNCKFHFKHQKKQNPKCFILNKNQCLLDGYLKIGRGFYF